MIEQGLLTFLKADAGITAFVGTRIYALRLPQKPTLPAITFQRISGARSYAMGTTAAASPRIQIDCWASEYKQAKDVAESVRSALNLYSGAMGTETVKYAQLEDDSDDYDEDAKLWRVSTDYIIWHAEA